MKLMFNIEDDSTKLNFVGASTPSVESVKGCISVHSQEGFTQRGQIHFLIFTMASFRWL